MTVIDSVAALCIAFVALYGIGLPLAWLLPAPEHSPWVLRIAVAPLYAIATASAGAWALALVGVPLHPGQLVAVLASAWVMAGVRTRREWGLRRSAARILGPLLMIGTSAFVWFLSLTGYGLYLPNRDFKNHAYMVAQVAWTQSADPALVLRPSPVSAPVEGGFYPLGLHTLLGWCLPTTSFPTPGVTAASAVLVSAISLPLALVVLARSWDRSSEALWWVAGFVGVFAIGLSSAFPNGSLLLITGAALYPAGLAALWWFVREPDVPSAVGVAVCGLGLLLMHIAEAVGLSLVALACLPSLWKRRRPRRLSGRDLALLVAGAAVVVAVSWAILLRMSSYLTFRSTWDYQANSEDPLTALLVAVLMQPEGSIPVKLVWLALAVVGLWLAVRAGMSGFPLVALAVPVVLGMLAGTRGVPLVLDLLTAPWYGSAARSGFLALAPLVLAGSLTLVRLREASQGRLLGALSVVVSGAAVAALAIQIIPMRRMALANALAGAGDTPEVAEVLAGLIAPHETVLNFEGDGTANLFADARIPVLAGLWQDPELTRTAADGVSRDLSKLLLRLDEPSVGEWFDDLGVGYVAIGTTSRYWREETGYAWQELLLQRQFSLALDGTDMVVLRYRAGGG